MYTETKCIFCIFLSLYGFILFNSSLWIENVKTYNAKKTWETMKISKFIQLFHQTIEIFYLKIVKSMLLSSSRFIKIHTFFSYSEFKFEWLTTASIINLKSRIFYFAFSFAVFHAWNLIWMHTRLHKKTP